MAKTKVTKAAKAQRTVAQTHRRQHAVAVKRAAKAEAVLAAATAAVEKATANAVQARQTVVDAEAVVAADVAAAQTPPEASPEA